MHPGSRRSFAPTRATWVVPIAVVAVILVGLWYGHAPPRSDAAYRTSASDTAGFLHSQLETARVWVQERPEQVFDSSLAVAIEESESDANATLKRFAGYDPPAGQEAIRTRLTTLGEKATTLLAEMRIAVHREDWSKLEELRGEAEKPSLKLEELGKQVLPQ
ncbi:MAG: hypothetical protein ACTHKG_19335 [Nocardioides sp.]